MMKATSKPTRALALMLGLFFSGTAFAQPAVRAEVDVPDAWRYNAGVQYTGANFKSSISRKSAPETGLTFDADNAQMGGVGGRLSRSVVNYNNGNPKLTQTNQHLSGRMYQRNNTSGGRIIYRLDYLHVDNTDSTRLTDDVKTWAPKIGLLTAEGNMFVDLEYAQSSYNGGLRVKQFAPSVGFAFNDSYDWINFKSYLIRNNIAARAMNNTSYNALAITWTHYFGQTNTQWMPASISVGVVLGSRMYAVDTTNGSISNLSHINRNGFNVGANWKITRDTNFSFYAGSSTSREPGLQAGSSNISYRTTFANLGLSTAF
jgi:hypothetical protein